MSSKIRDWGDCRTTYHPRPFKACRESGIFNQVSAATVTVEGTNLEEKVCHPSESGRGAAKESMGVLAKAPITYDESQRRRERDRGMSTQKRGKSRQC